MNPVRKQILETMKGFKAEGSAAEASFAFTLGFIGFEGHFSGNPVFPGICQVQAALVMLEAWDKRKVCLEEIISAKFYSPVSPEETMYFKCSRVDPGSPVKVKISCGDKKIAELKLKVFYA
jgi:3-hydroxymyristoyl/3-hydroxydecanoyl-(acyl carrier protein) dehydratase